MEQDEADGAGGKKKKAGLKAKVAKQIGRTKGAEGEGSGKKRDYVDLFDKPDRRKGAGKKKA